MCGRFLLTKTADQVAALFGLMDLPGGLAPRYNIAPTQPILTVLAGHPRAPGSNLPDRRAELVRWGLLPSWVKDPKVFPLLFNARSETAVEKNAFRAAMRHRRALVPASGFYEWRRDGDRKLQAWLIRPRDSGIVAFAGLVETYLDANGSEIDTGAILTTAANETLAHIHDRMPVVVRERDFARWLNCIDAEPHDVADILVPAEPDLFEAIPVSDRVNKVGNDGPELAEPVTTSSRTDRAAGEPVPSAQLSLF